MPGRSSCTMQSYALPRGRISCVAWFSGLLRKGLHGARFLPCLALTMGVLCPASPCAGNIFSAGSLSGALFAGYSPPGESLSGALWTGRIAPANADTGGAHSGTPASGHPTSGRYTSRGYQGIPSAPARPSTMVIRGTHALPEAIKLSQNEPLPLTMPQALVIVTHPTDVIDCEDHVVSFKVVISGGTDPITYTWQRMRPAEPDFTDLPAGAPNISYPTPGTLRIDNVGGFENPGGSRYRVVITDPSGSVTSSDALLTVNEITDILPSVALPSKTNVILCGAIVFSYTVFTSGTPPVAYQWKKYASPGVWSDLSDNAVISGSQGPVLTFTHPTPAESGQYKVHLIFHATGADCNVSSDSRIRVVTFYSAPEAPVVTAPAMACLGLSSPPLVATPASGGSGTFLCQWQESSDGTIWSDIPEACALEYQPPVATADRWYRLVATDTGALSCGNVTSAPCFLPVTDCLARHYRTIASGAWHNPTIWETSADGFTWGGTAWTYPTAGMRTITIREGHQVMVGQDLPVDQVTVDPGGAVTIEEGVTLTNVDPSGAAGFVIDASENAHGSLICKGNFAGALTARKYFAPSRWTIMASPLKVTAGFNANTPAVNFYAPTNDYDLGWYREEGNEGWIYFPTLPAALVSGRGYVIRTASTGTTEEGMISFTGMVNGTLNDTVSPAVYCTAPRHGWNAVGNPFTSAIGITASAATTENFLTRNATILEDSYAAVYLWNQTGEYDGTQQYYKAIGNSGYNFEGFSYYGGEDPDILQSGQGFLINVREHGRAIFSREMQLHAPEVKLKSAGQSWPGLLLTVRQGNRERQTVVAFHETMTTGLDKTFDAGLLPSDNFRLYTLLVNGGNSTGMQVQCLPTGRFGELVIPVGIDLPPGGEVAIGVKGIFLPGKWIPFLEDRHRGVTVALEEGGGEYTVVLPAGNYGTGRFFLRFGERQVTASPLNPFPGDSGSPDSRIAVTVQDGKLGIVNRGDPARAALYDLTGRKLLEFPVNRGGPVAVPLPPLSGAVYLLRFSGGREPQTVKVTIR